MYLLNKSMDEYPFSHTIYTEKLKENLKQGRTQIFFRITNDNSTVFYTFIDPDFGSVTILAQRNRLVVRNADSAFKDKNLVNVLIHFLYDQDSNASEEALEKRYGSLFEEYNLQAKMSDRELEEYKDAKQNFSDLLKSLSLNEQSKNSLKPRRAKQYFFQIVIPNLNYPSDFKFRVYNEKGRLCFATLRTALSEILLSPLSEASEKEKEILNAFYPFFLNNNDSRYSYSDSSLDALLPAIQKLSLQENSPVSDLVIEENDYLLNPKIEPLDIQIDKDGNIISNCLTEGRLTFCFSEESHLLFEINKEAHIGTFYSILNPTLFKLLEFKIQNPIFTPKYFLKEVTQKLVPAVKNTIPIEESFLSKSIKSIDHIEYYVDLDKEKLALLCKTRYFKDKKECNLVEFQNSYPDKIEDFKQELLRLGILDEGEIKDNDTIANFLSAPLENLQSIVTLFISEDLKKLKKKPVGKIQVILDSQQDWFSMDFQSEEYTKEEVEAILSAYKKKKKYFLLKDSILSLEEGEGKDLEKIIEELDFQDKKIPIYQVLKLKGNKNVSLTDSIKELFENVQNYEEQDLSLSDDLLSILRPYQIKGVKWLSALKENHLSGILADDMGLGKTLEMIAFLSQYHEKKPNLIVSPKSLTFNWEDEFHRWNKEAKVIVLSTDKETRHSLIEKMKNDEEITYIISYDSLRIDLDLFKEKCFGFLILDEGQYIANAFSQKTRAVKALNADYKFALTGTPIQNSLMDLWSLFDFLMPGYLKSYTEFRRTYAKYDIEKEEKERLENIVSPFLLKRKKEDVLTELPGKTTITQSLAMDEKEKRLYQAYLQKAKNTFADKDDNGKTNKLAVLAALTRMRQICVDPSSFLDYPDISSKLEYTIFLIKEAVSKDHKILLFSSFKTVLVHLEKLLEKENITFDSINGETSALKRIELAKKFNTEENPKVMLISLKAGGTGLNLIGADIVIHLDPWWNLAAEDQASDRAYRIGQKRKVTIYKIVMKNTIEEKVLDLQNKKKNLSDIFDSSNEKTILSDEDFAYLLS